jgi:hypothetical protein
MLFTLFNGWMGHWNQIETDNGACDFNELNDEDDEEGEEGGFILIDLNDEGEEDDSTIV